MVRLNRAVAVLERDGPAAALDALEGVGLEGFHLFHATRAEALRRIGDVEGAATALDRAIALASNAVEVRHLERERLSLR